MQITVKTLTNQVGTVTVPDDGCVDDLHHAIHKIFGIPIDQQRLIFGGKQLGTSYPVCVHVPDDVKAMQFIGLYQFNMNSEGEMITTKMVSNGERSLSSYGILDGSIVSLVLRLRGGMFHISSGRSDLENSTEIHVGMPNYSSKTILLSQSETFAEFKKKALLAWMSTE
jgi:hypothetical protein